LHQFRVQYLDELYDLIVSRNTKAYSAFLFKTNVVQADDAHNDYLQVLAEWGVVGFGLWLLIIVTALYGGFRRLRSGERVPPLTPPCKGGEPLGSPPFRKADGEEQSASPPFQGGVGGGFPVSFCGEASIWFERAPLAALICLLLDAGYAFPFQIPVSSVMVYVLLGCFCGANEPKNVAQGKRSSRILWFLIALALAWPVTKVLQLVWNTDRGERYALKAIAAEMMGKSNEALESYKEAYHYLPENGELYLLVGTSYSRRADMHTARDFYQRATETYSNPTLFLNQALVALEMRRYNECEEYLDRVGVLVPNHPQVHYIRGMMLYVRGKLEEAAEEFQQELKIEKDDLDSLLYLGQTLSALGEYNEAATAFKRATQLNPRNLAARENLGDLYGKHLRLPEQAVCEYTMALEIAHVTHNRKAEYRIQLSLDALKQSGP